MIANLIPSLLALALWLYGLYLGLTRTKSPTAKGVALVALLGLFFALGGVDVALEPESGGYPYTTKETKDLPALETVEISLTNAEVFVGRGAGQLFLTHRAKSAAALARMRPVVEIQDGRLKIRDDHQPKGTTYRVVLALPLSVALRLSVTNGVLKAEDRLKHLSLSATNAEVWLKDYRPTGPTTIRATNGEVSLAGFAPKAPTRINLVNGRVRVRAARPLRIEAHITNGVLRLPGKTVTDFKGRAVSYGPPEAPSLTVSMINGELDYEEVKR